MVKVSVYLSKFSAVLVGDMLTGDFSFYPEIIET
jgi:hypothetical protein